MAPAQSKEAEYTDQDGSPEEEIIGQIDKLKISYDDRLANITKKMESDFTNTVRNLREEVVGEQSTSPKIEVRKPKSALNHMTMVLVGKTGNGKSSTGNSIIGRNTFYASFCMESVTKLVVAQKSDLIPGLTIEIIDTPGLFDTSLGIKTIGNEITKCINLATNGIHAILMVLSVKNRFSDDEQTAVRCLQEIFGSKILEYVIIVFTGGDILEAECDDNSVNDDHLEKYLAAYCPESLQEILRACGNRKVLFDNKTTDQSKKSEQFQKLKSLVDQVLVRNKGEPYTDKDFANDGSVKIQGTVGCEEEISVLKEQIQSSYNDQLNQLTLKMESKLRKATKKLQGDITEEIIREINAERQAMADQIKVLKERLERRKPTTPGKAKQSTGNNGCNFL